MTKQWFAAITVTALVLTAGCQMDLPENKMGSNMNERQDQDPTLDISYNNPPKNLKQQSKDELDRGGFGYVHYSRKPGESFALNPGNVPTLDKETLADVISRLELSLPQVHDAGTLVTDQYVLIGYKTTNKNRQEAASQVKMTALSVVPNYYKVYVSDANDAISLIARFKDLDAQSPDAKRSVNDMINEMKQQPQGHITKNNMPSKKMEQNFTKSNPKNSGMDETERKQEQKQKENDIEDKNNSNGSLK